MWRTLIRLVKKVCEEDKNHTIYLVLWVFSFPQLSPLNPVAWEDGLGDQTNCIPAEVKNFGSYQYSNLRNSIASDRTTPKKGTTLGGSVGFMVRV